MIKSGEDEEDALSHRLLSLRFIFSAFILLWRAWWLLSLFLSLLLLPLAILVNTTRLCDNHILDHLAKMYFSTSQLHLLRWFSHTLSVQTELHMWSFLSSVCCSNIQSRLYRTCAKASVAICINFDELQSSSLLVPLLLV